MESMKTVVAGGQVSARPGFELVVVESFAGVEKERRVYANGEKLDLEVADGSTTLTLLELPTASGGEMDPLDDSEEVFDQLLQGKEKASDGVHLALEQYIDAVSQDGQPGMMARYAGLLLAQRKHARAVELVEEFVDALPVAGGE